MHYFKKIPVKLLITLHFLFLSVYTNCQTVYVIDLTGKIYSVDFTNQCNLTLTANCHLYNTTDIAIDQNGLAYVLSITALYSVNLANSNTTFLGNFSDFMINGLVALPDGTIYGSGKGLSKYDPVLRQFTYIGDFPPGITSAGDMAIYKGKMYLSAANGSIYEINTSNPLLSTEVYNVGLSALYGIAAVNIDCGGNTAGNQRLMAFQSINPNLSKAYLIDIENNSYFPDFCFTNIEIAGCTATGTPTIASKKIAFKQVNVQSSFCEGLNEGSITVEPVFSDGSVYLYSLNGVNTTDSIYRHLSPGSYIIQMKNQYGCTADTTVTIPDFVNCSDTLFVPGAFTPNGDGINDVFTALAQQTFTSYRLQVYNIYGKLIFSSASLLHGWDGTFHSLKQPPGVYVWKIEYTGISGKKKFRKGTVVLIR